LAAIIELLQSTGHWIVESGSVGVSDLQFAVARRPRAGENPPTHEHRSLGPLPVPRWILPAVIVTLIAAHGFLFHTATSVWTLPTIAVLAAAALLVAKIWIVHRARPRARSRD
jgi:hypothetical protein